MSSLFQGAVSFALSAQRKWTVGDGPRAGCVAYSDCVIIFSVYAVTKPLRTPPSRTSGSGRYRQEQDSLHMQTSWQTRIASHRRGIVAAQAPTLHRETTASGRRQRCETFYKDGPPPMRDAPDPYRPSLDGTVIDGSSSVRESQVHTASSGPSANARST